MKQAYLDKIRTHFPEISFQDAREETAGWDNHVLILDEAWCFRFPLRDDCRVRFRMEVELLRHLVAEMPVPIPDYVYLADDRTFGGYRLLPGTEMRAPLFDQLEAGARTRIAMQLGAFLSMMHSTPVTLARQCGLEEEPDGWWSRQHTERVLAELRSRIFPRLAPASIEWLEHQFARYLSLSFDFNVVVAHKDLTDDHILIDTETGELTGIIDFGDAGFSDPALDFSGLWRYGEEFVQQVAHHYRGSMDEDFLARSRFPTMVHMAETMLILERYELPVTFEQLTTELDAVIASGLTL